MTSFTPQNLKPTWWKEGVCYQVWPSSFKDSNDDGLGDIPGIISKLDYLKDLGVDYVWLSPMYASPREDYGYDISDYQAVDPNFGTMDDMDNLIKGLHTRGMRLMLDLVVNHTSTHHKWFAESAKSRDNEFSDYYMWRDPKIVDGKKCPPNNWMSLFGGSAWQYVEARDQYYLSLFLESMPDLNWEDANVRKAIYDTAIEFWLEKGIDGFRVDVVNLYSKDTSFPDAPIKKPEDEYQFPPMEAFVNGPRIHEFLQEQRKLALNKFGDIVLVGECGGSGIDNVKRFLSPVDRELDMIFDFDFLNATHPPTVSELPEWKDRRSLAILKKGLQKSQSFISDHGLWATTFLENHDCRRSISSFGSDKPEFHLQSGKLLALLIASMSGSLFLYQGQEIGMVNVPEEWPESDLRDPFWTRFIDDARKKYPDDPEMVKKARKVFQICGRDHARTPVQWSTGEPYAGFSNVQPWIRVNENFRDGINVSAQQNQPDSLLEYWKKLLRFRKEHADTLIYGHTEWVHDADEKVVTVIKHAKGGETGSGVRLLVVLNYSDTAQPLPTVEEFGVQSALENVLFGTGPGTNSDQLEPWEGRIYKTK